MSKQAIKKRVLFLNTSGPIENLRSMISGDSCDAVAVAMLNKYLALPNTELVLVSAITKHFNSQEKTNIFLTDNFGLQVKKYHADYASFEGGYSRQHCIEAWIAKNGMDSDTHYLSITDEEVDIPGVTSLYAGKEGMSLKVVAYLEYLSGNEHQQIVDIVWNYQVKESAIPSLSA